MAADDQQLRQALAIVLVQRRRRCAEVDKWRDRAAQLELELEARQLPALEHPLQLLARLEPGLEEPVQEGHQAGDLGAAALWQQAAACLPNQLAVLDLLQRYLLAKELQEQPDFNPLPRVLGRTPLQAALELISSLLDAHAEQQAVPAAADMQSGAAPPAAAPATGSTLPQLLVPQHSRVLEAAIGLLATLVSSPHLMSSDDELCLRPFGQYLLSLACQPPAAAASPQGAGLEAQQQQQPQATQGSDKIVIPGGAGRAPPPPIDLSQGTAAVAHDLVRLLLEGAPTGVVLLGAAAHAMGQHTAALVADVTGQQPLSQGLLAQAGSTGAEAAAAPLDEAGLVHVVTQLAALLQPALAALPAWEAALGGCDAPFLEELAGAVLAAKEACKLIAVTHGGVARQVQRTAAQLVAALQQIAAAQDADMP